MITLFLTLFLQGLPDSTGFQPQSADSLVVERTATDPRFTPETRTFWVAAGSAVLSGLTAVLLKEVANDHYATYRQTLSDRSLDRTRRYDQLSAGALVALQLSLIWMVVSASENGKSPAD
ncbi:MAG: hypothetical protein HUU10_14080 [Bacteroidetes bacterium]|nr:hypothetical protein [Bacteroidota bacterium]